jgi:hypothetical protein
VERTDVLDGDECIRIDLVDALSYGSHFAAFNAAIQDGNRSVFSPARNLRHGVSGLAKRLCDRASPPGADDADVAEANSQTILDHHAYNVACGETAGVSDEVEEIIQVAEHAGDGDDPQRGLDESEDPGEGPASPDDEQDPQCIQRHIRHAQEKDDQGHKSRVDCQEIEHRMNTFSDLFLTVRKCRQVHVVDVFLYHPPHAETRRE